jgi:hypothetical protein
VGRLAQLGITFSIIGKIITGKGAQPTLMNIAVQIIKYIEHSRAFMTPHSDPYSGGDNRLLPLDYQTPTKFENNYYKNLVARK